MKNEVQVVLFVITVEPWNVTGNSGKTCKKAAKIPNVLKGLENFLTFCKEKFYFGLLISLTLTIVRLYGIFGVQRPAESREMQEGG